MNRQLRLRQISTLAIAGFLLLGLMGCWRGMSDNAIASPRPNTPRPTLPMQPTNPKQAQTKPAPAVNSKLIAANTRFGFKLFSELMKQDSNENVFISPSSVAIALSMAYNGASGETQEAMAKALEVQGMGLPELNQANAALKAALQNPDEKVQLTIANSLWAKQGIPFQPEFLRRNQQYYDAQVSELNFQDPKAISTINDWVNRNTRGKITRILDEIKSDDVMFLINAIYFKGNWSNEFDKSATANKPFTLLNGTQKQHPLMAQTGDYRYLETDQFQAVSLPYGKKRVSMYVFLPKQTSDLSQFYKTLTADNWQTWMKQFRRRSGSVQLPRFKMEYTVELKDALSALGMEVAFNPLRANFANLSTVSTKIDQVKHKTFVDVNEEGTEAAAVTSIGIVATSAAIDEPFNLVVDRPFFCAIRDDQTGTVVFMGSIVDPK